MEGGDDCGEVGVLGDLLGAIEGDAADGDEGDTGGLGCRVSLCEQCETYGRIGSLFGSRGEHGPEGHVVGAFCECCGKLLQVVRGHADHQPGGELAHQGQGKILLTDVHAVTLTEDRQIGSVVGDQTRAGFRAQWAQGSQHFQRLARTQMLGAELK